MTLEEFLEAERLRVDRRLEQLLPTEARPPATLHKAMRYSVFAGGKRLRPILCIESARVVAGEMAGIDDLACAFEFIHTYSLIHDDLPALDNDDLRRGRPTCHKMFGEAMAILAGDGLLTLAFRTMAEIQGIPAERKACIIALVGKAAGTLDGMVGGQVADLEAEGKPYDAATLDLIHRAKTAAMIRAAVESGAIFSGANEDQRERLARYGESIGLAFQIVDDILDVESTSESLGKTVGKDEVQRKATYPGLHGLEVSRRKASELIDAACAALEPFGEGSRRLEELARFIVARKT